MFFLISALYGVSLYVFWGALKQIVGPYRVEVRVGAAEGRGLLFQISDLGGLLELQVLHSRTAHKKRAASCTFSGPEGRVSKEEAKTMLLTILL